MFEKVYDGTLSFHDLWSQHNEHRLLFPRLIMLGIGYLSNWNLFYNIVINLILGAMIFGVTSLKMRDIGITFKNNEVTYLAVSLVIFSLRQHGNWVWEWQIQIFLNVFAIICGCIWLSMREFTWKNYVYAVIAGFIATYSFANGMLFWLIGGGLLIGTLNNVSISTRIKVTAVFLWLGISVMVISSYLYAYHKPDSHPSLLYGIEHPLQFISFCLAYLGSPITTEKMIVVLIGFMGILVYFVTTLVSLIYVRKGTIRLNTVLPWFGLSAYALLSAFVTAVGRAGMGLGVASASRYTTIANLFWISLIILLTILKIYFSEGEQLNETRKRYFERLGKWLVFCAVITSLLFSYSSFRSVRAIVKHHKALEQAHADLIAGRFDPAFLTKNVYPNYEKLMQMISKLKARKLALYRHID